jgi:Secretion system C-terminal sorting domain
MLKKFFFLVLSVVFSANLASAQPGNPCDPATVAETQSTLIIEGFDCLVGAGPFTCVDEVLDFAFTNCPLDSNVIVGPCDPQSVAAVTNDLISQGFTCLIGAGPFECTDDVIQYAFANCSPGGSGGDPCDSLVVAAFTQDLISQGFDCLVGAGPFECAQDVLDFAFENCSPAIDTLGDCDPAAVDQAIADLLAQGYTCLNGAGPFTCVHEVVCYALDNCPLPYDTTGIPVCFLNIPASVTTFQQFINYIVTCDSTFAAEVPACWFTAPTFATDEEFIEWITVNCGFDSLMAVTNEVATSYFSAELTSSTNDVKVAFGVQISPNPTSDMVNIRLKEGEISRIELFDLNGRLVLVQNNVATPQATVNLSGVTAGMYMVRVYNTNNAVVNSRLVKQ